MQHRAVRLGLYFERLAVGFAFGTFLVLPLYFRSLGRTEVFFGEVYAAGAISTLVVVAFGAALIKRFGLRRIAPLGSLFFTIGSCLYVLAAHLADPHKLFFLASLLHGAGWGLVFTMGPICLSTTLDLSGGRSDSSASHHFATYAAYSQLGVGLGPLVVQFLSSHWDWTYRSIFLLGTAASVLGLFVSSVVASRNSLYASVSEGSGISALSEFWVVLKQPSVYFFAMIFLAGCIYTSMMNLQTTFAASQGIDYTVFYSFYALAVVTSRFALAKPISKIAPRRSMTGLLVLMTASLFLFLWADRSIVIYAAGSLVLGMSYGLVYPVMQGQLTKYSFDELRAQTMVYFSLSFFLAVYLFPYVAAQTATRYGYSMMLWLLILAAAAELSAAMYFFRVVAVSPVTQARNPKWATPE